MKPLSDKELRQIDAGISLNMRQPAEAARFLKDFVHQANKAMLKVAELEKRVKELEKPTSTKKPTKSDDI